MSWEIVNMYVFSVLIIVHVFRDRMENGSAPIFAFRLLCLTCISIFSMQLPRNTCDDSKQYRSRSHYKCKPVTHLASGLALRTIIYSVYCGLLSTIVCYNYTAFCLFSWEKVPIPYIENAQYYYKKVE